MQLKPILLILLCLFAFVVHGQLNTSDAFHQHRESLAQAFKKFDSTRQGRVAFLGGSITYNSGWRDSVSIWLENRFPNTDFEFINAGIPSMGSTPGAFRFERDVLKNGPVDLLFVESAVNDHANFRTKNEMESGIEGIIRHAKLANSSCNIILMYFVDPDKIGDYSAGRAPTVIDIQENIATHYNISSINLAEEVAHRIGAGEFDWENDFVDLHPSPFGQGVYSRSICSFLEKSFRGSRDVKMPEQVRWPEPLNPDCYSKGSLVAPEPVKKIRGWKYDRNWKPEMKAGTRFNYIRVPMLVGTTPGKVIKFHFRGNAVGIAVAAGPDAGVIEYSIDNSDWKVLDLFTPWSTGLYLPWYYTLESGLKNRKHTLQLRLVEDRNPDSQGSSCIIRYFYVNSAE